ncbi:MAG: phosphate ABC transporter substrate-binding protein PstS [Parvibaculaceae bacterium]|nr:phosphate ABC transporter substrate-binding protein PstS [Parvibaculaceae bacterium]
MFKLRKLLATAAILAVTASGLATAQAADISGAGATFPYPLYGKWAAEYKNETGVGMNYQSIGSGGGIKQIKANTVDFGASDKPLSGTELEQAGLLQFPVVMGGIVPIFNIDGVKPGEVVLSGDVLAQIYLGKIKNWNDPAIAALNKGVKLPDLALIPIYRSDGSGTSFNFTYFLNESNKDWAEVGVNTSVEWPVGLGGKGNEGVAALVGQTKGAIGYVEYAYALQNALPYSRMLNKDGKVVEPSLESFQAAAANADWKGTPGYGVILANQPGAASWPMTAATFILVHKAPAKPEGTASTLKFFDWAYSKGDKMAEDLHYVPLPDATVSLVESSWKQVVDKDGKPVF